VQEQEGRPLAAAEDAQPDAAHIVESDREAAQEIRRIRHEDRLSWLDYELRRDRGRRVTIVSRSDKERKD
jgi:hypothetical protein